MGRHSLPPPEASTGVSTPWSFGGKHSTLTYIRVSRPSCYLASGFGQTRRRRACGCFRQKWTERLASEIRLNHFNPGMHPPPLPPPMSWVSGRHRLHTMYGVSTGNKYLPRRGGKRRIIPLEKPASHGARSEAGNLFVFSLEGGGSGAHARTRRKKRGSTDFHVYHTFLRRNATSNFSKEKVIRMYSVFVVYL